MSDVCSFRHRTCHFNNSGRKRIKIADFFDVSTDYLLRGKDKSSNIITDDAKKVLNDPETFLAAKDGEVTDEILQAALEIITEQLKERRKSDK